MTQQELSALVGKEFMIRRARHICLAASAGSLLFLQICARDEPLLKAGDPIQYVVARHPSWHDGELTWDSGSYYPLYKVVNGRRQQGVTGFHADKSIHSRKPEEMREMIERVSYSPAIELFARDVHTGWDCWGNE